MTVSIGYSVTCYMHAKSLSHVQLFVTLWTVACQAPLSVGFSRQEYWSQSPFPPAGDLPKPGIAPTSLTSPALAGRLFTTSTTWEVHAVSHRPGSNPGPIVQLCLSWSPLCNQ